MGLHLGSQAWGDTWHGTFSETMPKLTQQPKPSTSPSRTQCNSTVETMQQAHDMRSPLYNSNTAEATLANPRMYFQRKDRINTVGEEGLITLPQLLACHGHARGSGTVVTRQQTMPALQGGLCNYSLADAVGWLSRPAVFHSMQCRPPQWASCHRGILIRTCRLHHCATYTNEPPELTCHPPHRAVGPNGPAELPLRWIHRITYHRAVHHSSRRLSQAVGGYSTPAVIKCRPRQSAVCPSAHA
eukprot:216428-Pleurochrysis_carterae.AAC.1